MEVAISTEKTSSRTPVGHIAPEGAEGNLCLMLSTETEKIPRGVYVRIDDNHESFIARIFDGPFFGKDSALTVYKLELTAMMIRGRKQGVSTIPRPGSAVMLLDAESAQAYLGSVGDILLGRLVGQTAVKVALDSRILTRHMGLFGTTGSGKSNTLQVLAEESSQAHRATLIFDVEGEYVKMNEPTTDLVSTLAEFDEKPKGIVDFQAYVPASKSSLNADATKFGIPLQNLDLDVFSDVLALNAFERFYLSELAAKIKESAGGIHAYSLDSVMSALRKRVESQMDSSSKIPQMVAEAHMSLFTKLSVAKRAGVIDASYEKVSPEEFCAPGRVSVIDLSESSDILRNICVAHFLNEVFRYKTRNPTTTPLTVFVEEIHTFISKGKSSKMLATLTMLTEMARQGRKRGLSLGIVSQQPGLLPAELIELCNTRFIHKLGSLPNLEALRNSTGNVPESLWNALPSLARGEALIASPALEHAVITLVRPNRSKRLKVEFG
ncbi:MAG TPA: ATP-binding protein [Candidatus Dormibacteraeota bacterium]|nr:ATP-binding protein [Candidatus Dormibacteraeota bacterium]